MQTPPLTSVCRAHPPLTHTAPDKVPPQLQGGIGNGRFPAATSSLLFDSFAVPAGQPLWRGYSVKVNRDGEKYYLVCSGRSNLGLCNKSIQVNLRDLAVCVASELETLLLNCPDAKAEFEQDQSLVRTSEDIDRKIDRLIDALAQSTDMSMTYINRI